MCLNMVVSEFGIYGYWSDVYDGIIVGLRLDVYVNVIMYCCNIEGEILLVDIESVL